jgi:hypothetical protein
MISFVRFDMANRLHRKETAEKYLLGSKGDIYFNCIIPPLPPVHPLYARFIPNNPEKKIPLEDRAECYYSIGAPNMYDFSLTSVDGKLLKAMLSNLGEVLYFENLAGELDLKLSTIKQGYSRIKNKLVSDSKCFFISRELSGIVSKKAIIIGTKLDCAESDLPLSQELFEFNGEVQSLKKEFAGPVRGLFI